MLKNELQLNDYKNVMSIAIGLFSLQEPRFAVCASKR
jgi:hypothetical protein